MRGFATNNGIEMGMAPIHGEQMVIAGVRCTFDGRVFEGRDGDWMVTARASSAHLGEWVVGVGSLSQPVIGIGRAVEVEDAASEALRKLAGLVLLYTFVSIMREGLS